MQADRVPENSLVTACKCRSIRAWQALSDDGGRVAIKLLWDTNLRMLCATDLFSKYATDPSPIQQMLLVQHGAVDESCPSKDLRRLLKTPPKSPGMERAVAHTAVKSAALGLKSSVISLNSCKDIFSENVTRPGIRTGLPRLQDRIERTEQLVYCRTLLLQHSSPTPTPNLDKAELEWLEEMDKDLEEQERLRWIATRMVEEFVQDAVKDSIKIAEIVALGPVLEKEPYRKAFSSIFGEFDNARLLDVSLLQGLVQLVQSNSAGYLEADDLVKILSILRVRLQETHGQSSEYSYHLTLAVARILDVMAEHEVKDLDRVVEHEPLSGILSGLKGSSDPYMMYQACYAFQALQYVPDDETVLQTVLRKSSGVVDGLVKISAVFKLDLGAVLEGLQCLQEGLEGVKEAFSSAFEVASTVYEGVNSLMESGRGILDNLKDEYGSGKRRPWYAAIRAAHALVQSGQLKDLNSLIYKAPCRHDPLFQWGICQLLAEIASDAVWDTNVRLKAVVLLGELYKNDLEWGQDGSVKTWMLSIIGQLGASSDQAVRDSARNLFKDVSQDEVAASSFPYPLRSRLPLPTSSPTLARVLVIPDVEYDLYRLKLQQLEEYRKGVYIPPQAKPSLKSGDDTLFPLMEEAQEFLTGHRQVMLVLGDSGSGKSTFIRELEHTLWKNYKKYGPIPLYINLPTIDNPAQDLIEKQLQYHNFSEDQIREIKLHRQLVLICDGYDESQLKVNIHTTNQFNQPGQWKVKIVISCRTQYLGQDYRSRFQPQPADRHQRIATDLFREAVVAAFSRAQIQQYVDEYVKELPAHDALKDGLSWTAEEYMDKLANIPNLMDLVSNPFLLTLALDALPSVVGSKTDLSSIRITRVQLYDSFVKQWLEVNRKRLESSPLSAEEREELYLLIEDNFSYQGILYQKDLSTAIFMEHGGRPVVKYTHLRDKNTWKAAFFSPSGQAKLLRESSTVMRSGAYFQFLHRSLLEYFYSRTIYDPMDYDTDAEGSEERAQMYDLNTSLAQRSIIDERSIVQFLAERVRQDPSLEQQLRSVVDQSKTDATAAVAAANAISILVRAGVTFHDADLRGIRVPEADLSNGQFDSAQFQGAIMTGVNLARTWLRQADMTGAQMEGVQFGELLYLELDEVVSVCAFSPDTRMVAVGLLFGSFNIYETTNWSRVHKLIGHTQIIQDCAFSPNSQKFASASWDHTVRVWDTASGGEVFMVLEGHTGGVLSVSFSPCGKHIASSGMDGTIRLWDSQTGDVLSILKAQTRPVENVRYSADGRRLISSSKDRTIRFWDSTTGELDAVWEASLGGDLEKYHPRHSQDGRWIACCYEDGRVQLWDTMGSGGPGPLLRGHTGPVTGIAFSPNGQWIASAGNDKTVRLWDASTGILISTLTGHTLAVSDVAFSPDGLQLVSGGNDKKVRLWEVNASLSSIETQERQMGHAQKLAYSLDGQAILSLSGSIIQQWDRMTGSLGPVSFEFPDVLSIDTKEFPPNGNQITDHLRKISSRRIGSLFVNYFSKAPKKVEIVSYSPCCRWVAFSDRGHTVSLQDLYDTKQRHILLEARKGRKDEDNTIGGIAFSRDGQQLVVGSWDGTVWLFDPQSRTLLTTKTLIQERVLVVTYSPSGRQLALGTDSSLYLWDLQSNEPRIKLDGHSGLVGCIAYSPCGQWLASGSEDETVRLWHRQTGEEESWLCVSVIRGFFGSVEDVVWHPVVPMELATACKDGSIRVWRVSSGGNGDGNTVAKLLWGSNPSFLCAAGLVFKDATGLSLPCRKLLVQRGAVGDALAEGEEPNVAQSP
ncbi:hypothetical protein BG015_006554 [Linnemannia schmuckeri]|uniref:WD40 repeat-like protein n=1 Tax=Linnemannia schmuckeri TaxID=64567 RepID=A0A9P5VBG8_9FUNG|nr:hypothetical protein BG015_006554 [Linnemannia schmuckeri]